MAPSLPVLEESATQIEAGEFQARVATACSGEVAMIQVHLIPKSIGVTVAKPGYIGFAIPHWWRGDYRINGDDASLSALYTPDRGRSCHIAGSERFTTGVFLPEKRFVETLATLRGIDPDQIDFCQDSIELTSEVADALRRRFNDIMGRELKLQQAGLFGAGKQFEDDVLESVLDAVSGSDPVETNSKTHLRNASRIVRRAEERFAQAQGSPVSLADLCQAAGVSKTALYEAFHFVCEMPPLAYFHKRRLNRARSVLLTSSPERGAVKEAALGAGFTQLGRFSEQYQALFGELPSVSLQRGSSSSLG